jgi:hypothetical protein
MEKSLSKRIQTCCKTDYRMNGLLMNTAYGWKAEESWFDSRYTARNLALITSAQTISWANTHSHAVRMEYFPRG